MPRRSSPPRLERDRKRPSEGNWYIYWTEGGRSREHSTGTGDRDQAELYFAEWKLRRFRPDRAVEPYEFYVADAISHYLAKRLDDVSDPERLANAAKPIIRGQQERRLLLLYDGVRHESQKWDRTTPPRSTRSPPARSA